MKLCEGCSAPRVRLLNLTAAIRRELCSVYPPRGVSGDKREAAEQVARQLYDVVGHYRVDDQGRESRVSLWHAAAEEQAAIDARREGLSAEDLIARQERSDRKALQVRQVRRGTLSPGRNSGPPLREQAWDVDAGPLENGGVKPTP